jgi:hypothetical protein
VWNSTQLTVSDKGTELNEPHTDEEWAVVMRGAVTLVEAANLLMIPGRHMAKANVKSVTPGIEREPDEMERLVNADRAAWNARARALQENALEGLAAVDTRNAEKLWEVGGDLDGACENCHRQYWYPNEKLPSEYAPGRLHASAGSCGILCRDDTTPDRIECGDVRDDRRVVDTSRLARRARAGRRRGIARGESGGVARLRP